MTLFNRSPEMAAAHRAAIAEMRKMPLAELENLAKENAHSTTVEFLQALCADQQQLEPATGAVVGSGPENLLGEIDRLRAQLANEQQAHQQTRLLLERRVLPEGWKAVPVVPTDQMLASVTTSKSERLRAEIMRMAKEDYALMLDSAPSFSVVDNGDEAFGRD